MVQKLSRAFGALILCALPAVAALNPTAVSLNVTVTQKQGITVNSKRSDGMRDRTTSKTHILQIECRNVGGTRPEAAILRWFFVSKDPVNNKFGYESIGGQDITIVGSAPLKISAVSEPLNIDEYVESEGYTKTQVTAGNIPVGWVVMLCQNGLIVKQTASTAGLIEWMGRNPPPKPKDN